MSAYWRPGAGTQYPSASAAARQRLRASALRASDADCSAHATAFSTGTAAGSGCIGSRWTVVAVPQPCAVGPLARHWCWRCGAAPAFPAAAGSFTGMLGAWRKLSWSWRDSSCSVASRSLPGMSCRRLHRPAQRADTAASRAWRMCLLEIARRPAAAT